MPNAVILHEMNCEIIAYRIVFRVRCDVIVDTLNAFLISTCAFKCSALLLVFYFKRFLYCHAHNGMLCLCNVNAILNGMIYVNLRRKQSLLHCKY